MTGANDGRRAPGTILLKIAALVFSDHVLSTVVQPTISDLQREVANAAPPGLTRLRARWRGYRAFWTLILIAPFVSWPSPTDEAGAVAFPEAIARLAIGSIVVTLLLIIGPVLGAWVAAVTAVGTLCAILIHAWYIRHPSDLAVPRGAHGRLPQINFSSTDVADNIGGLIFVVGSVFIVVIGVPSVIWFLSAATLAGGGVAWALAAWHASHPKNGLPENQIVLR